ncbi:hypothetical protein BC939DRAFT_86900 [Gamsiella multidivaricata]|uniref:uncharacterized protein n=1 Tax=Gamsiella multidivaricata TaxID=101098 RepID=UPI00221E6267|nr:uncharacterized protein BC939DRAFT_86900 [Gamsiella multidivaricata]KAI7827682.1 hypothetical protein BC939DRAFT_86900 [Gamsiella multidivaricata]
MRQEGVPSPTSHTTTNDSSRIQDTTLDGDTVSATAIRASQATDRIQLSDPMARKGSNGQGSADKPRGRTIRSRARDRTRNRAVDRSGRNKSASVATIANDNHRVPPQLSSFKTSTEQCCCVHASVSGQVAHTLARSLVVFLPFTLAPVFQKSPCVQQLWVYHAGEQKTLVSRRFSVWWCLNGYWSAGSHLFFFF